MKKLIEITSLDQLKIGHELYTSQINIRTVLAITGSLVALSNLNQPSVLNGWYTLEQIKAIGLQLEVEEERFKPNIVEEFYMPCFCSSKYVDYTWTGKARQERYWNNGLVFPTEKEAIAMTDKILAFIKKENGN